MTNGDQSPHNMRPQLLQGSHVGLAVMHAEDAPIFARWYQDLRFTARLGLPGEVQTLEMRRQELEQNTRIKPNEICFSIILCETGAVIGFGGLFDITRALTASMFIAIAPELWGRGYGSEASRLILEYGFFFKSLHAIKIEVNGFNAAALGMYERLGFKPAGRVRGALLLNGRRYDQIIMDLLRDELETRHVKEFRSLEH